MHETIYYAALKLYTICKIRMAAILLLLTQKVLFRKLFKKRKKKGFGKSFFFTPW